MEDSMDGSSILVAVVWIGNPTMCFYSFYYYVQDMFRGVSSFNGDLSNWDVSRVTYMWASDIETN